MKATTLLLLSLLVVALAATTTSARLVAGTCVCQCQKVAGCVRAGNGTICDPGLQRLWTIRYYEGPSPPRCPAASDNTACYYPANNGTAPAGWAADRGCPTVMAAMGCTASSADPSTPC
jgi:hypothetical protein